MIKILTADLNDLQDKLTALDILQLRYTVRNDYQSIGAIKQLFIQYNREYNGIKVNISTALNTLINGDVINDDNIVVFWTITLYNDNGE